MEAMSPQQETLGGPPGRSSSLAGESRIAGGLGTKKVRTLRGPRARRRAPRAPPAPAAAAREPHASGLQRPRPGRLDIPPSRPPRLACPCLPDRRGIPGTLRVCRLHLPGSGADPAASFASPSASGPAAAALWRGGSEVIRAARPREVGGPAAAPAGPSPSPGRGAAAERSGGRGPWRSAPRGAPGRSAGRRVGLAALPGCRRSRTAGTRRFGWAWNGAGWGRRAAPEGGGGRG